MTNESDTPRTDEVEAVFDAWLDSEPLSGDAEPESGFDIARTLETELRTANERVQELEAALKELVRLKTIKEMIESGDASISWQRDYDDNKEIAWLRARAALTKGKQHE